MEISDELWRTNNALRYALDVIKGYELDIRNARVNGNLIIGTDTSDSDGPSLQDLGFCQGRMYTEATRNIEKIRLGQVE